MANRKARNTGNNYSRMYNGSRKAASVKKKKKKSGSIMPVVLFLILAVAAATAVLFVKSGKDAEKAFASLERSKAVFTKKGTVTVTSVEDFDKDYYDSDELLQYIDSEIADYNKDDKKISRESFLVADGTVRLAIRYESVADYVNFNAQDMVYETLESAENAGYDFSKLSGKKSQKDETSVFGEGTAQELKNTKVIIFTEPMDVTAPYDILYCSDNMSVKSPKEAEYTGDITEDEPGILILEK